MLPVLVLVLLATLAHADAQYRVRAPHPPLPPSIHYGSKPPPSRVYYSKPPHHYFNKPPPPRLRAPIRYPPLRVVPRPFPHYLPSPLPVTSHQHYAPPAQLSWPGYGLDDNTGPIHTIPAPNLSPADRPASFPGVHSSSVEIAQSHSFELQPERHPVYHPEPVHHHVHHEPVHHAHHEPAHHAHHEPAHHHVHHEPAHHHDHHHSYPDPERQQSYLASNDHAGRTHDGQQAYYAPDPDPSLPAPKIPATTDPHSHPSNGKLPLDLAIQLQLEKQHQQQQQLTPDNLLQLLNYKQPVDSYGVPLTQPQFHSFNYQETVNQVSPFYTPTSFYEPNNQLQETSGSENVAVVVEKKLAKTEAERNIADNQVGDEAAFYAQVGDSAYASLPNREAAERLAGLAAAGSVISRVQEKQTEKKQEKKQERGDIPLEEEYDDDEEEEDTTLAQKEYGSRLRGSTKN